MCEYVCIFGYVKGLDQSPRAKIFDVSSCQDKSFCTLHTKLTCKFVFCGFYAGENNLWMI